MSSCVTETSYYLIFTVALIISLLQLVACAYHYDKIKKYENNPSDVATNSELTKMSNITLGFFISGTIGMITLLILFFGFQKRLLGVYTTIAVKK